MFIDDSSSDHLRVEKAQGLTLTVKAGRANINGAFYWQKDDETITLEKNSATKSYNIILRLNDNDAYRNITLVASDIDNGITRSDSIYDLVLATVTVTGNASEVKGSDITDTRLDSTRCGAVTSAIKSVQSLDLFTQVTELFKEIKAQNESEMNANRTEFNDWFETVKDTLDADTAGKLSNRISSVEKMIMDNHFTTVLLAEDGTLVDENGHEILADWKYKVDGSQDLNGDNIGDSDKIAYELENPRNQMKFELEQTKAETSELKEDLYELDNLLTEDVLSVINENTPTTSLTGKLIDREGNLVDFTTWKTMYFTATEDFKMYVDNFTNNYFRIGIFDGEIKSENLISLYMKNIDDGTNTLPTVDNKANVKTGNTVVFSMTSGTTSFKIFKVTRVLVYEPKKMYYSKSGNIFDIYVQSKTSDNFMHYVYKQDIDDSINLNTWRFYTYEIVDENFNRLYGCSQVTPSIEMDSVVKETDSVDFMGGYHGDENMTALSVLVDGKVIDMSEEIPLTKFYKEIRFCGTSIIDKCNTPNDNMFTRYKTNVFSLDGYYSKQRWVALQECNLQLAYMGMMSLPVADNGITMVTTARMDNNYIEQKFHENTVENGAKYPSKDVREVEIYGNKLYGKARFFTDNYDSAYRAFCDDSQNNNFKAYFRVGVGVSALHTGEELRGEMHVEFMY